MLGKKVTKAFGKKVYLIGEDQLGTWYWMEEPRWDCDWYWAFGYVETYTNNERPDRSRDIESHQHWKNFVGNVEHYDVETNEFTRSDYIHNINNSPRLTHTVFTEEEGWYISDLMQRFYTLKETANLLYKGNSHISSQGVLTKNDEFRKWINEEALPEIFQEVQNILTPKTKRLTVTWGTEPRFTKTINLIGEQVNFPEHELYSVAYSVMQDTMAQIPDCKISFCDDMNLEFELSCHS